MLRSEAVSRINDAVGFRPAGHDKETVFIRRLQEAQRDLEKGKTLPRFLLVEDQQILVPAGTSQVSLPAGFLREHDDNRLHFVHPDTQRTVFLRPVRYNEGIALVSAEVGPSAPSARVLAPSFYVLRRDTIDFIAKSDRDYTLIWDYFKAAAVLDTDIENEWLVNAAEWLIGEAGERIARDLRDNEALELFQEMKSKARAAIFGDELARDDSEGPVVMGQWL